MNKDQYRALLAKFKISQEAFAEAIGIGKRTSQGYANGEPIPIPVAVLLQLLARGQVSFAAVKRLVNQIKEAQ
jgi:transcriptional regulator with XRE-family HTH domain